MPILAREVDVFPANLFELLDQRSVPGQWWALYTISRREKELMRRLLALEVPFYGPVLPKRGRTPAGRSYIAYEPLFRNYVFLFGDEQARYASLTTRCVSKCVPVVDNDELTHDLRQFHDLIALEAPLLPESRLLPGQRVRIRSGKFRGVEGTIVRREHEVRLLVAINFIQQGASLLLNDYEVEAI